MKIAIDIDEVIVKYVNGLCDFYNSRKGNRKLIYEDFDIYAIEKILGISKEEEDKIHKSYTESKYFDNIGLIDGAIGGVEKLAKDNEVVFITARPERDREKTIVFFKKLFQIILLMSILKGRKSM